MEIASDNKWINQFEPRIYRKRPNWNTQSESNSDYNQSIHLIWLHATTVCFYWWITHLLWSNSILTRKSTIEVYIRRQIVNKSLRPKKCNGQYCGKFFWFFYTPISFKVAWTYWNSSMYTNFYFSLLCIRIYICICIYITSIYQLK